MGRISMDDLCGGALLQKFNMEMMKIGQNIMNPNTNSKKARKMTITITFKPDESRRMIETSIETKSTLAPLEPISTVMLAGKDIRSGLISMAEYGNDQQKIQIAGDIVPVQTEEIRPERAAQDFNPDTGEIYESGKPIDLRKTS